MIEYFVVELENGKFVPIMAIPFLPDDENSDEVFFVNCTGPEKDTRDEANCFIEENKCVHQPDDVIE